MYCIGMKRFLGVDKMIDIIRTWHDEHGHKKYLTECSLCKKQIIKDARANLNFKCECELDLSGKDIGYLHVNYLQKRRNNRSFNQWNCTCICGKTIVVNEKTLVNKKEKIKSCGCIDNANNLVGQKFGKLTVIDYVGKIGGKCSWLCVCKCGEHVVKTSFQLHKNKLLACDICNHNITFEKKESYYKCMIQGTDNYFYIDIDDFEKIKNHNWNIKEDGYIWTSINNKNTYLHRYILDVDDPSIVIDHINHKKYDNRKSNLRKVTHSQNSMNNINQLNNMNGIRKASKTTWRSQIYVDNKCIHLGSFKNLDDAIHARKLAEEKFFGEYSYSNSMRKSKNNL